MPLIKPSDLSKCKLTQTMSQMKEIEDSDIESDSTEERQPTFRNLAQRGHQKPREKDHYTLKEIEDCDIESASDSLNLSRECEDTFQTKPRLKKDDAQAQSKSSFGQFDTQEHSFQILNTVNQFLKGGNALGKGHQETVLSLASSVSQYDALPQNYHNYHHESMNSFKNLRDV